MPKKCPKCGNVADDSAVICPNCGEAVGTADDCVSVGTYLWLTIVYSIPVVGLIISIVMAFAPQKSRNLTNFARAYMIIDIIITVLLALFAVIAVTLALNVIGPASDWLNSCIDKLI